MELQVRQFCDRVFDRALPYRNKSSPLFHFERFKIEPPIEIATSRRRTFISDFPVLDFLHHMAEVSTSFSWKAKQMSLLLKFSMHYIENHYAQFFIKYNGCFEPASIDDYIKINNILKVAYFFQCLPLRTNGVRHKRIREIHKIACSCCASRNTKSQNLTFHHIIPLSLGGLSIQENLTVLCRDCHQRLEEILSKVEKTVIKEKIPFFFLDYVYMLGEYICFFNKVA